MDSLDWCLRIALFVGGFVVFVWPVPPFVIKPLYEWLQKKCDLKKNGPGVPGWFTGLVERIFFWGLIAAKVDASLLIIGWLGLKLATNWSRPLPPEVSFTFWDKRRRGAFQALVLGLINVMSGAVGGLFSRPLVVSVFQHFSLT